MDFAQFFSQVEARVGVSAPLGDGPDTRPAPWFSDELDTNMQSLVHVPTTRVDILDTAGTVDDWGDWPADRYDPDLWWDFNADPEQWIDAIAAYRPWHVHRQQWGIVVDEILLGAFTSALALFAGADPARLAPFVLRQVLAHEFVHFSFEVAATEIEDVLREPRYLAYLSARYERPNRWTPGALEEVIATWAELTYATGLPSRGPRCAPKGYVEAVRKINRLAPPGYCDFELMSTARTRQRIVADVASLVADRDLWSPGWWPRVTADDCAQVPLHWQGDPDVQKMFGVGKSISAPSMRTFERWLYSTIGAIRVGGTKHAKAELPNGRRVVYKDDGPILLAPEANAIAQRVGLRNRRELYEYVARGLMPPLEESAPA